MTGLSWLNDDGSFERREVLVFSRGTEVGGTFCPCANASVRTKRPETRLLFIGRELPKRGGDVKEEGPRFGDAF